MSLLIAGDWEDAGQTPSLQTSSALPDSIEEERLIVDACRQGDVRAFERVYREHQNALFGVALRMLGGQEDAEDAVQTTLIRLYRSIRNYRFEARLGSYLMRILINVCYDMLKTRKKHSQVEIEPVEPVRPAAPDLRLQLEEAILTLPDRMRACFVLFAVEGYAQREIAEMLDVRVGTVKAQIFQAKERLRALLADPDQGERAR